MQDEGISKLLALKVEEAKVRLATNFSEFGT